MSEPLRVVIADDHAPTRAGVQYALEADGCVVLAAVSDASKAVAAALEERPEVCLLDINMPGGGIRAASQITSALPDTAVVMLTASRDDEDLFDALRAGASGYLLKDMDPDRLAAATGAATAPDEVDLTAAEARDVVRAVRAAPRLR